MSFARARGVLLKKQLFQYLAGPWRCSERAVRWRHIPGHKPVNLVAIGCHRKRLRSVLIVYINLLNAKYLKSHPGHFRRHSINWKRRRRTRLMQQAVGELLQQTFHWHLERIIAYVWREYEEEEDGFCDCVFVTGFLICFQYYTETHQEATVPSYQPQISPKHFTDHWIIIPTNNLVDARNYINIIKSR